MQMKDPFVFACDTMFECSFDHLPFGLSICQFKSILNEKLSSLMKSVMPPIGCSNPKIGDCQKPTYQNNFATNFAQPWQAISSGIQVFSVDNMPSHSILERS